MEKFSMLALVLLSTLTYVTEARTVTTRPVEEQSDNAIDVNNAVGEQGGNANDVNSAAEEQILGDAAGCNNSLPSNEEDDTDKHKRCCELSRDELRERLGLLVGKFIHQGGDLQDLQDTSDDRFENETMLSVGCSENLDLKAINRRAVCPWINSQTRDRDDRYPGSVNYTKCDLDCEQCGSGTCRQVRVEQYVLVRGECEPENNKYECTLAKEYVPVACVCERSRKE